MVLAILAGGILGYGLFRLPLHQTGLASYASYLGLPAFAAILFGLSTRLRPDSRMVVLICTVATVGSLYAAEIYLTYVDPRFDRLPAVPTDGVDRRSKMEVVYDERRLGRDAWPYASPDYIKVVDAGNRIHSPLSIADTEVWPFGFAANVTTVVCREGRDWLVYRTDEHGFNNPSGLWSADTDILFLGDSYTHGECVPRERSFVGLVRGRFPKTLTLGASSTGPLIALATLKEYGAILRPREVFWVFFEGNDLDDLASELRSPLLGRYRNNNFRQNLLDHQEAIDRAWKIELNRRIAEAGRNANREQSRVFGNVVRLQTVRNVLRLSHPRQQPVRQELVRLLGDLLEDARQTTESWGGRLHFVYLPSPYRYHSRYQAIPMRDLHEQVRAQVRGRRLPIVDIVDTFARAAEEPLALYQGHLTEAGNRIVADAILDHLSGRHPHE